MPCPNHPNQVIGLVKCVGCGTEFCVDCVVKIDGRPFCAECRRARKLDVPEDARLVGLNLAPVLKRAGAALIDWLVTLVPAAIVFLIIALPAFQRRLDDAGPEKTVSYALLFSLIASAAWVVYEGAMLTLRAQTLGKIALGIRVVTPEGADPGLARAWLRAVARGCLHAGMYYYFPLLFIVAMVDYLPAFLGGERKALHDSVAGTRVVVLPA